MADFKVNVVGGRKPTWPDGSPCILRTTSEEQSLRIKSTTRKNDYMKSTKKVAKTEIKRCTKIGTKQKNEQIQS